jgi:hypothetical protein
MTLFTGYSLPFSVLFEEGSLMSVGQDVRVRTSLSKEANPESVDTLDSMILPFFLLATSGALSGENIAPWDSTIKDKSNPIVGKSSVEWLLKSCKLDERSLVILSQMLLSIHNECAIHEVMFSRSDNPQDFQQLTVDQSASNPYPGIWRNLDFACNVSRELGKDVTIHASFSETLLVEMQEEIDAELFSWVPGLVSGAYGVAPILPIECTGIPDDEITFTGNELEWYINRVIAHHSAFSGLVNVFASISHQIAQINELLIE